jgi:hypothetical protein
VANPGAAINPVDATIIEGKNCPIMTAAPFPRWIANRNRSGRNADNP